MSDAPRLVATRLMAGVWQGWIAGDGAPPDVAVTHDGHPLDGVALEPGEGGWRLSVPVPVGTLSDGVQVFVVADRADGRTLGVFRIAAGDALGADLRAEIEQLRAELDLLKDAFRRHCRDAPGAG